MEYHNQWEKNDFDRPAPIGVLLNRIAYRGRWQKRFARAVIWKEWESIAGEAISENVWPLRFREGDVLVLVVSDSVWMQQLSLQKMMLLDAINSRLAAEARIRDIRLELGDVRRVRHESMPGSLAGETHARHAVHSSQAQVDYGPDIEEKARKLTSHIKDSELQRMLQNVYKRVCARQSGEQGT